MLSVYVVCCINSLTSLTNVSIEANSLDPDQTYSSSLILVHTVWLRGFYNISADDKADEVSCDLHFKYGICLWMKNIVDSDLDVHYFERGY